MHCIQDTVSRFAALQWPGAAPDHAFDLLGPVLSRRLHIAAGSPRSCCGATLDLVAADPADPALSEAERTSLRALTPGRAVASTDLPELSGGWIAVPGIDIRIVGLADLGGPVIAITFADAVAMLSGPDARHLTVRTTAVVAEAAAAPGWNVVRTGATTVPLACDTDAHLAGCAA